MNSLLQIFLGEFYNKLNLLNDIVKREAKFPKAPNKIKVAIGMRRVGKTYFLYQQILNMLLEGISKKAILYINFEDDRLLPLNEVKLANLVEAFYSLYPENHDRKCYFFFDEIQNVPNWPIVIRRLHDTKNAEIFLTGSSAKLLSREIATSLRGRSLATEIWPYSFNEFIKANQITLERDLYDKRTQDTLKKIFQDYLFTGGFPEITSYAADIKQKTLQEYIDVTIYRDIIERHNVKHPTIIKYMILSMIHNVAKPFSVNKFYNDLKSQGYPIGKDILYEYLDHIEDAYLAFSVPVYEKSIRKSQTHPKKLYAIDPALVRALTLDYENDLGRLFENIVYLDLRRQECHIKYYQSYKKHEIDFLAQTSGNRQKFFQVVWEMNDPKTYEREHRALDEGMNEMKFEGEIITLDSYLSKGLMI